VSPTRRDFLGAGAAAAAAAAGLSVPGIAGAEGTTSRGELQRERNTQNAERQFAGLPVVISSGNGFRTKHADGRPAIQVAYDMITRGADPLDAAIAGVQLVELDPTDHSVGLKGFPNAEGVVQLDASCMHGPSRRAGAVASLEDIATPAAVAKMVMDRTDHLLLVGPGAKKFALEMGFKEDKTVDPVAHEAWLKWKSRLNANDAWLDLPPDQPVPLPPPVRPPDDDLLHITYDEYGVPHTWGTINMNAIDAKGDVASVTTTSGMSWKIPGRVGDSPIIGAGQYCDNLIGAAGSTGRGEANIKVCGAFLAVEFMRQGMSPEQSLLKVMERVIAMTELRLLDDRGRPYFGLEFYAVNKKGEYAGASAYEGGRFAVCDAKGPRVENCVYLFKGLQPVKRTPDGAYVKP
jgi:N4-(beta-N-acetylglucosaminyl)-L-asparaginase